MSMLKYSKKTSYKWYPSLILEETPKGTLRVGSGPEVVVKLRNEHSKDNSFV